MRYSKLLAILMMGMVFISFPSCNGAFEDIYDEPSANTKSSYGFKNVDLDKHSGTVYINADSYTRWIYINFHNRTIDSLEIGSQGKEPADWDMAVHRYDSKVNGAGAMETSFTDLNAFVSSGALPSGEFVADVESKITIDMSGMMEGNIKYADSPVNPVLAKWLDVDTSSMPPIYTLSGKVYILKLKDGTHVALKLRDFRNEKFDKGYLTIDYIYPLEF